MSAAVGIEEEEEFLTLEEFAALHFDEVVELVDGRVKLLGNNNPDHSEVLVNVTAPMKNFVKEQDLGRLFAGDVTVLVRRGPDTGRGIDLAFASHKTLEKQPAGVSALHIAPELAIEIMSPSNPWEDVQKKISEYLEIGVREVWVISISVRTVSVYHSITDVKIFADQKGDSVSSPEILPGFELPLSQIFEGLPPLETLEKK